MGNLPETSRPFMKIFGFFIDKIGQRPILKSQCFSRKIASQMTTFEVLQDLIKRGFNA
jgi:hypothetical protein